MTVYSFQNLLLTSSDLIVILVAAGISSATVLTIILVSLAVLTTLLVRRHKQSELYIYSNLQTTMCVCVQTHSINTPDQYSSYLEGLITHA